MKAIACILGLFALSCCTPDAIKPGAYVAQGSVPKAKPVSEAVSPVRSAGAQNSTSAALIARATRSLREDLEEATAAADRLRKVEAITAEEKNALWVRLTEVSRKSILLEGDAAQAQRLAADLTSRISDMEIAARTTDEHNARLRDKLAFAEKDREAKTILAQSNGEAAEEWSHQANKLKGKVQLYDMLLFAGAAIVGLLAVVKFGPLLLRKSATGGMFLW